MTGADARRLAASWAAQGIGREFIILGGKKPMKIVGLVQAHHRGWAGAQDFSLARVDGKLCRGGGDRPAPGHAADRAVTIAVPDDPGNEIFRDIAAARGARCFFGSRENVLERCSGALDAAGADIAVHVMGQHCFVDTALLARHAGLHGRDRRQVRLPAGCLHALFRGQGL